MFKGIEVHLPAINLDDISVNTLKDFADRHNDHLEGGADTRLTLIRVIRHELPEIGRYLHVMDTAEGLLMIYVPDFWTAHNGTDVFEQLYPYLHEIGLYQFSDFMGVITDYNDDYFRA